MKTTDDLIEELLYALELALPYVEGRYECAFPHEIHNEYVERTIRDTIAATKEPRNN